MEVRPPTHVLHIGARKCGSSALQTALSRSPSLRADDGRRYAYTAIDAAGGVLCGEELAAAARRAPHGYLASTATDAGWPEGGHAGVSRRLAEVAAGGAVPILSAEAWMWRFSLDPLDLLGDDPAAHVIAYVRPHAEVVNGAWWQWGAWNGTALDGWIDTAIELSRYAHSLQGWAADPRVARLDVRVVDGDVVADFGRLVGVSGMHGDAVNSGPGAAAVRLFQRPPARPPAPHDSEIEFVIERTIGAVGRPNPWVLDRTRVERILAVAGPDVEALRDLLAPDQAERLDADPRWTDPAAFAGRVVEPPGPQPPPDAELDALAAAALAALRRLDERARERGG